MYIWLKKGAESQLAALKEKGLLGDVAVKTSRESGKNYVPTYSNILDPTEDLVIPEELVEKVTIRERIEQGFRAEGIYRHDGAVLMILTRVISSSLEGPKESWQEISIVAPSVEKAKAIYTLVRQGKLAPEENWDDICILPPPAAPTETVKPTA